MVIQIPLIQEEDMRIGRGGGRKSTGERYPKYRNAIVDILPWIKEQIADKESIIVKVSDLAKEMGSDFERKNSTSLIWGMKYVLFHEGIWAYAGKTNDNSQVLIMRNATEDDVLPGSLTKLDKDVSEEGGDVSEEGGEEENDDGEDNGDGEDRGDDADSKEEQ